MKDEFACEIYKLIAASGLPLVVTDMPTFVIFKLKDLL